MSAIKITVFKRAGRKNYEAQWVDPVTGLKKTKSTGCQKKRDAEREAGKIVEQLEAGTFKRNQRITWEEFRERYETEKLATQRLKSQRKNWTSFNLIEEIINPKHLASLDATQISRFQTELRSRGRTESTIRGHLANLKAALRWAREMGLIQTVPKIVMPKSGESGGRPITREEFERMLAEVPRTLYPNEGSEPNYQIAESWRHLLNGLWWSGLRLGEALKLHWEDDSEICVDFSHKRPMFRIDADTDKAGKTRVLVMAPEFAEFLAQTPESERHGYVFNPRPRRNHGMRMLTDSVTKQIAKFGKDAAVKVSEKSNGKIKYASAHDLRRAFGLRWAERLMPNVLMELMRHQKIETTMKYYVGRNAEAAAEAAWQAAANTMANTSVSKESADFENP